MIVLADSIQRLSSPFSVHVTLAFSPSGHLNILEEIANTPVARIPGALVDIRLHLPLWRLFKIQVLRLLR